MHPAQVALLTDVIQHEVYTGQDGYGASTYASPIARLGRLETRIATALTATGLQQVQQSVIFFDGTFAVGQRDRFTLPSGAVVRVQAVQAPKDQYGVVDHVQVVL